MEERRKEGLRPTPESSPTDGLRATVNRPGAAGGVPAAREAAAPSATLLCIHPEELIGKRYDLPMHRSPVRLGRFQTNDIVIASDDVSRRHCSFHWDGDAWVVQDEGSTNGTRVNDEPITRRTLRAGDRLYIGGPIVKFLAGDDLERQIYVNGTAVHWRDGLTGLWNRRKLYTELDRQLQEASDERPLSVAVVQVDDIDHLLGERVGLDLILRTLAEVAAPHPAPGDVLAHEEHGRLVWVMVGAEESSARDRADALRAAVEAHHFEGRSGRLPVTVSVGVATHQRQWERSQLLDEASSALYAARQRGNSVEVRHAKDGRGSRAVLDGRWLLRKVLTESPTRSLVAFELEDEPTILATIEAEGLRQWNYELQDVVAHHLAEDEYLGRWQQRYVIASQSARTPAQLEAWCAEIEGRFAELPIPDDSGLVRRCRSSYVLGEHVAHHGDGTLEQLARKLLAASSHRKHADAIVQRLPQPLAIPHVIYPGTSSSFMRAKALADGIEQYLRFLVAVAIGWLRTQGGRGAEQSVVDALRAVDPSKQLSGGAWMQVARKLARAIPQGARGLVPDLLEPFGAQRGHGAQLQRRIEEAIKTRNDFIHHQRPNEHGYEREEELLRAVFLQLTKLFGALQRARLVSVRRVDEVEEDEDEEDTRRITYVVREHRGPQELFPSSRLVSRWPLQLGWCALVVGEERPLPLAPVFWSGVCDVCNREELFAADGLWSGPLRDGPLFVFGITTGHRMQVDAPLKAWDRRVLDGLRR